MADGFLPLVYSLSLKDPPALQHTQYYHQHKRSRTAADKQIQMLQGDAAKTLVKVLHSIELAGIGALIGYLFILRIFLLFGIHIHSIPYKKPETTAVVSGCVL